ncbi:MAG TPA: serine hydrolase domain-containing protein, partial [Gemmatimonadales bacterium]|nr:serine hydrolase domain-containing protein [Gemmatimonadales bacterium]
MGPRVLAAVGRLLPPPWRDWARAMTAELDEIPSGIVRRRFVRGCVGAILLKAIELRIRGWLAQPVWLLLVLAAGVLIALLDRASDSRTPMWLTLLAGSALLGWFRPAAAWRWGVLLAIGIPLLTLADPADGAYARDRADAGYGLLPAVALAAITGFCRRRFGAAWLPLVLLAPGQGLVPDSATAQAPAPRRQLTPADLSGFADSIFAEYLRLSPEPSLALVVVKDDSILFARGYGSKDPSSREPVDPEATVFWLGSLSKLITADAVMREIDRGRLTLDAAAGNYLDWPLPSRAGWQAVTVRNLLTHTSGLDEPFMAGTADRPEELIALPEYLARVHWRAGHRPGELLRYSNHGMALAGLLVERVSATPFAEYVEREIFGPLAMRHSSFRQPMDRELSRRLAVAGTDARADFLL